MVPRVPGRAFRFEHFSVDDVRSALLNLKKGPGADGLTPGFLREAIDSITEPLTSIFNRCLAEGVFPDNLKIARVLPLFKDGDQSIPGNYRPISLLNAISKAFEHLIVDRIIAFLERHGILSHFQFGFQRRKSAVHAILLLIHKIRNTVDSGRFGCGIFLDLKKAFDTVDYDILFMKLEIIGFTGPALQLIRSYLSDRSQFIEAVGHKSDYCDLSLGVPQGSVLGPLLFLLYINDMPLVSNFSTVLFADDACLYCENSDLFALNTSVSAEMEKVYEWLIANKLSLNLVKTKYVIFTTAAKQLQTATFQIAIRGSVIERSPSMRYLGVVIDQCLTFKPHIAQLRSRLSRNVGLFWKLRRVCGRKLLIQLYYVLIDSLLSYANIIWCATYPSSTKPLYLLQKKALKILSYVHPKQPGSHLFQRYGVLSVYQLHFRQLALHMYDHINDMNPIALRICIQPVNPIQLTRRQLQNISNPPTCRTNFNRHSVACTAPKAWSQIPSEIRNIPRRSGFALAIRNHIVHEIDTDYYISTY